MKRWLVPTVSCLLVFGAQAATITVASDTVHELTAAENVSGNTIEAKCGSTIKVAPAEGDTEFRLFARAS